MILNHMIGIGDSWDEAEEDSLKIFLGDLIK